MEHQDIEVEMDSIWIIILITKMYLVLGEEPQCTTQHVTGPSGKIEQTYTRKAWT